MTHRLILLFAILSLIVGVLGIVKLFNSRLQPEPFSEAVDNNGQYVTVWVATKGYEKGEAVSTEGVTKKQVPLREALILGVREDVKISFSPSILLNKRLNIGDVVLPEYQVSAEQPGYIDLLVTEGMTLYPLKVSNSNLINDYIRAGSFVDILTVSSPHINLSGNNDNLTRFRDVKATMFLKNVKVLNIGDSENGSITARKPNKEDGMTTVVIEVKPHELAKIALAQRTMHIEIYRSQSYILPEYADVSNVIDNYTGIKELRGRVSNPREAF